MVASTAPAMVWGGLPLAIVAAEGLAAMDGGEELAEAVAAAIAANPEAWHNCGVWILEAATGRTIAWLRFDSSFQQVFEVRVLRDCGWPEVISNDEKLLANAYDIPPETIT